ncbi:hypothetical protein [Brevundimonas sp. FT23028]|uniref:hypothetical protein n=1 Tax=Brevundimonas sp. FT23028 TaxID=3393748 RepID=UPI003B58705F
MTFDYARAAQTAQRLLQTFGATGAIRRQSPGTGPSYDPGEPTLTDYPCTLALTKFSNREIDGARILATDRKALVSPAVEEEPTTSDLLVTASGEKLTIVNVMVLRPETATVLYQLQVRA